MVIKHLKSYSPIQQATQISCKMRYNVPNPYNEFSHEYTSPKVKGSHIRQKNCWNKLIIIKKWEKTESNEQN